MGRTRDEKGEGELPERPPAFHSERLAHTLAVAPAAITVSDENGSIVYANDEAVRMIGFERAEDVLSAGPGEIAARFKILDADGGAVDGDRIPSRRVAARRQRIADELLHVVDRRTGDERWWRLRSVPFGDENGRRFAVTVSEDVTAFKQAEDRQAFLARAGEVLASSLDYEKTLRAIAELAVPRLADWCGVDVLDDGGNRRRLAVVHKDREKVRLAEELNTSYPPDPEQPTGVYGVLRSGQPELYARIPDEMLIQAARDEHHLELIRALGMRSLIFAPMRTGDGTIGVITFVSSETERVFDESDLEFAMELARRAAVAVANARLYTLRTEASRTLQQSLLPATLETPPGWSAAHIYRPGDDLNEVGGDFYDLVPLPDGSSLAFVGDVTGKGVRAAALTSLARHALAVGARFDPRPSRLMRLLEDVLLERSDAAPITVACVRVTPTGEGASAVVTCAGHPPPLLLRPGEAPTFVGLADILLGAGLGDEWREMELELRPGDTLLLYTDGVTDTPGVQSRFGEERLRAVAADGPLDPESVVKRIDDATIAWRSGRAVDDRAMLALQLEASPGRRPAAALVGRAPA